MNIVIFTYINCYSTNYGVILVNQKNADNLIKALNYAFNFFSY